MAAFGIARPCRAKADAEAMDVNPGTGVMTFEAEPSEVALLHAGFEMRRNRGSLPNGFILGSAWRALWAPNRMPQDRNMDSFPPNEFLMGGANIPVAFDLAVAPLAVVVLPKRIGPNPPPQNIARIL